MQVYIWEVLIYHVCNIAEIFIRWSTHWFKVIIHIPEEWKGEEVHFRWNSASEAMVIIILHTFIIKQSLQIFVHDAICD